MLANLRQKILTEELKTGRRQINARRVLNDFVLSGGGTNCVQYEIEKGADTGPNGETTYYQMSDKEETHWGQCPSHWDCSGENTQCSYRKGYNDGNNLNHDLWGVVIQRLTCEDHQDTTQYCFKYLRFMNEKDSAEEKHSEMHEIFWAEHKNGEWKLVKPITADDFKYHQETTKKGALENPPTLPTGKVFDLPTKFKQIR